MSKDRINELIAAYNDKKITLEQFKEELLHQEGWVIVDEERIYPIKGSFVIGLLDLISRFVTKEEELKKILNTELVSASIHQSDVLIDSLRAKFAKQLLNILNRKD